jgi:hypothetical protein
MAFKPPAYPGELTDQWWQKNKGMIAKVATKDDGTGIGKKLTALKKEFDKITDLMWRHIDFELYAPGSLGSRKPDEIKEGIDRAKKAALDIQPVYRLARQLEVDAKQLSQAWSRSKLIPKSSTSAALKISTTAEVFSFQVALGTFNDVINKGLAAEAAARKRNEDIIKKALKDLPSKLTELAKDCDSGVKLADWQDFWGQNVRFLGTQMAQVLKLDPGAANEVAAIRVHANKCRTPKDQGELDGWLKDLAKGARALNAKLG